MTNRDLFRKHLEDAYADLFANDPDYSFAASRTTPAALATTMTGSLAAGTANFNGAGIKRACKAVGIKQTMRAIRDYLRN